MKWHVEDESHGLKECTGGTNKSEYFISRMVGKAFTVNKEQIMHTFSYNSNAIWGKMRL